MMRRPTPLIAVALVVVACGNTGVPSSAAIAGDNEPAPAVSEPQQWATPAVAESRPVYEGFEAAPSGQVSLAALARGETDVYSGPGEDSPMLTMPWTTILNTVTVLAVVGEPADGWVEVMLPVRPNGSTGWVRTDDVHLYVVEGRIVVDLSDRRLTYYVEGEEMLTSVVAVGTSRNPTPTGVFFVTDSVTLANPNSPWGPHALGLSARSETITEFNGGDGIIGIHGTNNPSSIGKAASLGCVRLPNEVIAELHSLVSIGTTVEIRA